VDHRKSPAKILRVHSREFAVNNIPARNIFFAPSPLCAFAGTLLSNPPAAAYRQPLPGRSLILTISENRNDTRNRWMVSFQSATLQTFNPPNLVSPPQTSSYFHSSAVPLKPHTSHLKPFPRRWYFKSPCVSRIYGAQTISANCPNSLLLNHIRHFSLFCAHFGTY
jgi:hypothetical protein